MCVFILFCSCWCCSERMYSHRSEYSSHRRQDADRSPGQWDDRPQAHSKYQWDFSCKTPEDGPSSRTQESSVFSRDLPNRDSDRRQGSSPVLNAPVKRSWTCAKDQDFRYRHQSDEETQPEDFRYSLKHVDGFQRRGTPPGFRPGRQHDEVTRRDRHEDSSDQSFSDCFSDEDFPKRRRDSSRERMGSPDHFSKVRHRFRCFKIGCFNANVL